MLSDLLEQPRTIPAPQEDVILDRENPLSIVRSFLNSEWEYWLNGERMLQHYQGVFFGYTGVCYQTLDHQEIRSRLYGFLDRAFVVVETKKGEYLKTPFRPTKHDVDDVLDALKAEANLSTSLVLPAWLNEEPELPINEVLICQNGLLHLPTRERYPSTPQLFAPHALPVEFSPNAPKPERWHQFLSEVWPNDQRSIDTLQEWFGYLLTPDTRQQKIALLVGPKRSGKGTIARIIKALFGESGYCSPTLESLSQQFGLANLVGKSVAVVSDARLRRSDTSTVAERLLSISGEDSQSVPRKYLPDWNGKLAIRFMILTNELPNIADAAGALASRYLVLRLINSFFGKEDPQLTDALLRELPGILNWAVAGWERLHHRGHFVQPKSARELIQELEELGSPILSFIRERCKVGAGHSVSVDSLFRAWKNWCESNGQHEGDKQSFGRDLRAAVPGLKTTQPRVDRKQTRTYQGIRLVDGSRKGVVPL
jgi:putative DNA primase/helicase